MIFKRRSVPGGFTIVELLIVIVIIAILALIAISSFGQVQRQTRNTARIDYAKAMEKMLYSAKAQNSTVPTFWSGPGEATCLGEGLPDVNSDGNGDCYYNGTSAYFSVNPAVMNWLKGAGSISGEYPTLPVSGNNPYRAAILAYFPSTVDGISTQFQLRYYLEGANQNCVLKAAAVVSSGVYTLTNPANNSGSDATTTACVIPLIRMERL
ncbi:prepilin-type N-terminal cleavage/methylation domain-containing protein [Candidatus Saccharibacteria bacterium]|nr:prepilin-type N-terminal cleavage/methylation domain-containing protein [Candidatus Saccharibacteria bacterium]